MSIRLQTTLQDLADRGVTANDLTADEMAQLVHACERVENPFDSVNADLMEKPVLVADCIYLWPPTAGAVVWLTEYVEAYWKKDSMFYRWAQVYALVNARDPEAFVELDTRRSIRAAVLKCALRLCVHTRELRRAVDLAYGVRERDAEDRRKAERHEAKTRTDFGALVARLEVQSGIPRETWLWGRSVMSLMKSYTESVQLAAAAFGSSKEAQIELDAAVQNLAATVFNIVSRVKGGRE